MKRTPVSDLPVQVVADIAECAVMYGYSFNAILEFYYGRDALSVMGWLVIRQSIHGLESLPC